MYSDWHVFYFRMLRQARKVTLPYNNLSAELHERAANESCRGRRFFTTSSGLMSLGPLGTRVGDEVAVFDCGRTPFVLGMKEQRFVLLGECHVHGIMSGEAVFETDPVNIILVLPVLLPKENGFPERKIIHA